MRYHCKWIRAMILWMTEIKTDQLVVQVLTAEIFVFPQNSSGRSRLWNVVSS